MSRILTSKGWRELNEKRDDVLESDSYAATMAAKARALHGITGAAKAHAEKDGKKYGGDVQHKYDAYHAKKRGYTHFTPHQSGSRTYHRGEVHGATKITSDHHSGVSE